MIIKLKTEKELKDCAGVIKDSFKTVADEFQLTSLNAPTHPSFITFEKVKESADKGASFFGLYEGTKLTGCIAVEESGDTPGTYYIERLSVLPGYRHKGCGRLLMDFAFNFIKERKGQFVSIGIMNENTILKNWYLKYGFKETAVKTFPHLPFTVCFMKKEV